MEQTYNFFYNISNMSDEAFFWLCMGLMVGSAVFGFIGLMVLNLYA